MAISVFWKYTYFACQRGKDNEMHFLCVTTLVDACMINHSVATVKKNIWKMIFFQVRVKQGDFLVGLG